MLVIHNPFKFKEIVRNERGIRISGSIEMFSVELGKEELDARIVQLRSQGLDDYNLAQELLALKEYRREVERDNWDSLIDA